MNGEKSRAKEHQEFFVADSTGRENGVIIGEGLEMGWIQGMERWGERDRVVSIVGWKIDA